MTQAQGGTAAGRRAGGLLAVFTLLALSSACGDSRPPADPAEILLLQTEGTEALRRDDLETARARFDSILAMAPDEALGHGWMGMLHLRAGELEEAQAAVREGLALAPESAELRLMLAAVLRAQGDLDGAREALELNRANQPDHLPSLWALARLETEDGRVAVLRELAEQAPANDAARFELARALVEAGNADGAAAELEALRQQLPALPDRIEADFDQALTQLQSGDASAAAAPLERFGDYYEATGPYQEATVLNGPAPEMVGIPSFSFSFEFSLAVEEQEAVLEQMRYADGSRIAGLEGHPLAGEGAVLAMADLDGDGDEDLIAGNAGAPGASLHRVDLGLFIEETPAAFRSLGRVRHVAPADWNNDGHIDLLFLTDRGAELITNGPDGAFEAATILPVPTDAVGALWADLDHDGDLDAVVFGDGMLVHRNDGDGSFTDVTTTWGLDTELPVAALAFGDLDDDGDLDLVGTGADGTRVWSNERGGNFSAVPVGLDAQAPAPSVAVVDLDHDGQLDLAFGSAGAVAVWLNDGTGSYRPGPRASAAADAVLMPIDFDNDGVWDLVAGGSSGLTLLRGDGTGTLADFGEKLPGEASSASSVAVVDYNEDGDLDLIYTTSAGDFRLARNDGANSAHYIQMSLEGLAAGSGKNNRDGIGSRVEVSWAGGYQVHVVTKPEVHIGLGPVRKADVIRIEWTNGVTQDIYYPGTDQDLEDQILKGSCPMLFTWTGEGWEFQKDIMWKSALGMPTGILGNRGARSYAPAEASREYVRIPGDRLVARDGVYELRITEELWETIYIDELELMAVDHPDEIDVFMDERFVPPHLPTEFRPHLVQNRRLPVAATDHEGRDVLGALSERDHTYVSGFLTDRYQGTAEMHWVELELDTEVARDAHAKLFLTGWVFPSDASLNVAMAQGDYPITSPVLEVPDGRGGWEVAIQDVSFPSGKDKTIVLDIGGLLDPDDPRVRVRTGMQIYWDQVFASIGEPDAEALRVQALEPSGADLRYRGFSRTFRKGGRYGPHWFDYDEVEITAGSKWRDLTGNYTRYGDVQPLLTEADDMYVIMNAGDEVAVRFDANALPELPEGWTRDFVIYSVGWVKDGDLNTAAGQTVEPLPFHGMSAYPYGPDESYPTDAERQEYLRTYNPRVVEPRRSTPEELRALVEARMDATTRPAPLGTTPDTRRKSDPNGR